MRLGDRRTKCLVQAFTASRPAGGLGQEVKTWATVATVWGRKRYLSAEEKTNASQVKALADFVVETWDPRSLVTVTPKHRLLIGGVPYGITGLNNVGDENKTLLIYCTENVA